MRKCQRKKRVFIFLSFEEIELIGTAGSAIKNQWYVPGETELEGNENLDKKIVKVGNFLQQLGMMLNNQFNLQKIELQLQEN